jgi:hypothetical protein
MPADPHSLRLAGGLALAFGATLVLHAVHIVSGHAWFSFYGPLFAVALTSAILALLRFNRRRASFGVCAALLGLLVLPEWLEGEFAAGHALSWTTLESHGATTLLVLGVASAMAVLWEASRVLALMSLSEE